MRSHTYCLIGLLLLVLGAQASLHRDVFSSSDDQKHPLFGASHNLKMNQFWFNQTLDHFNLEDTTTFQQQYFVTDQYWDRDNGQVILYICGEGPCHGVKEGTYFISTLAQENNALIIALEHRFYGASQPFKDLSTEHLKYLTVEQALADLANFIQWAQSNASNLTIGENRKWVTYGGSYPGALSAWFRYKYPHLTAGAVASSAVINVIADFGDYDHQIFLSASKSGKYCTDRIQELVKSIEDRLYANDTSAADLKKEFNASYLSHLEFLYYYSDSFSGMVQYGQRTVLCGYMNGDTFEKRYNDLKAAIMKNDPMPYAAANVKNDSYWAERDSMRQWTWQTCIDMGWFQTAYQNASESLRSQKVNLQFFKDFCEEVFGKGYFPNEKLSNAKRGGLKLDVSNLVMVNGIEDPWQWASRPQDYGKVLGYMIDCDNCAHCVDIGTPKSSDSLNLYLSRAKIAHQVNQWLN